MALNFFGSHFICAFNNQFRLVGFIVFSEKPGLQNQFIVDTIS